MSKDWKLAAGAAAMAAGLALPASGVAMPTRTAAGNAAMARPAVAAGAFGTCYQTTPGSSDISIPLTLTGGGPGDNFDVDATEPTFGNDADGDGSGVFDSSGNASLAVTGVFVPGDPSNPTAGRPVAITVNDYSQTTDTSTPTTVGTVLVSEGGLSVNFDSGTAFSKKSIVAADTAFAGKQIYGFVTNRKGKVLRRFHVGKADPSCGYVKGSAVIAPSRAAGTYDLYLNAGTKLDKQASRSEKFTQYRY